MHYNAPCLNVLTFPCRPPTNKPFILAIRIKITARRANQ